MAYIGKQPVVGNFQKCDAISVVNGQAAYTLNVGGSAVNPENANHMLVSLNGVLQAPGDSFTVSGSTLTFASNLATGDVIDFVIILGDVLDLGTPSDNSVSTAKLVANSVTAAKFNADVISGQTALAEAPADTDELLISDGGVIKRIDYSLLKSTPHKTLLSTTTLSSTSNVTFNNSLITSTYRDYYISFSNVHVSSDGTSIGLRFSTDNGSSFNADALYHRTSFGIASDGTTIYKNVSTNESQFNLAPLTVGNATGENFSLRLYLFNPLATDNYKHYSGVMSSSDSSANANQFILGGYWKNAADDVDAIKIEPASGNFASGTVKFYGIT